VHSTGYANPILVHYFEVMLHFELPKPNIEASHWKIRLVILGSEQTIHFYLL